MYKLTIYVAAKRCTQIKHEMAKIQNKKNKWLTEWIEWKWIECEIGIRT